MKTINAIVIDDESSNRDVISKMVTGANEHYRIIGEAENVDEGYKLIKALNPDLIFLDIKMPGENGFDLLRKFDNPAFEVVFITGFDEYALKAFEFNAIDYILKPIDPSKLKITLAKVQNRIFNKKVSSHNLKDLILQFNNDTITAKIPIHFKAKVLLLNIREIISIHSEKGYTVFTINSELSKMISSKQLNEYEFIISNFPNFIRLNKGVYINTHYMKNYTKGPTCEITMNNGSTFEVSRRKKTEILAILERNNRPNSL